MEHLSGAQLAVVQKILDGICSRAGDVQLALLASTDGFQLASAGSKNSVPDLAEKFAAMASSMSALNEAAGKELGAAELDTAVMDFKDLQMILRKLQSGSHEFVLAFASSKAIVLGNLLWTARECAHGIEEALRR